MAQCSVSFGKTTIEIHPSEELVIVSYDAKKLEIAGSENAHAFFLAVETIIAARRAEKENPRG